MESHPLLNRKSFFDFFFFLILIFGRLLHAERTACGVLSAGSALEQKEEEPGRFLSVLHLFADLVAEDLVPVDLGASDGQLSAESFEGGVWHCLVVLADGRLEGNI